MLIYVIIFIISTLFINTHSQHQTSDATRGKLHPKQDAYRSCRHHLCRSRIVFDMFRRATKWIEDGSSVGSRCSEPNSSHPISNSTPNHRAKWPPRAHTRMAHVAASRAAEGGGRRQCNTELPPPACWGPPTLPRTSFPPRRSLGGQGAAE
jgi:hypothetical protein